MFKWLIEKYNKWIIGFITFCLFIFVLIYILMLIDGPLPSGAGLEKADWLAFIGGYLSFIGTVSVAGISLAQSSYHNEMENKRRAVERQKEIQPLFAVEIQSINKQVPGTAELINIDDPKNNSYHKNFVLSIQIANDKPAKNVFIFGDFYLGSILKPGDFKRVCGAYDDSPDYKYENIAHLTFEQNRDEEGIPKWFNICYEDIDGCNMVQSFKLNSTMGTKFYHLEEQPWGVE